MHRRAFLRTVGAGAAGGLAGLAGCLGFETESIWTGGPVVEDRPDAVYVPSAVEGMAAVGTTELADGTRVALFYTYPHRFWTVSDDSRTRVPVRDGEVLHCMTAVWDPETGTVLPRAPRATVRRDGREIDSALLWPMLAQRMGYHFGDNVELDGDGAYRVDVDLDPLGVRGLGSFAGRFGEATGATFDLQFATSDVLDLSVRRVPEQRRGTRDAVDPMDGGGRPVGRAPSVSELPGTILGTGRSGDVEVVATLLDEPPDGVDSTGDGASGSDPYLAVSARTPYNRLALPAAGLSAAVDGSDSAVPLFESVEERLGHHYGAKIPAAPERRVEVTVDAPPQVSRHDGYETAFFDVAPVELAVGGSG